MGHNKKNAGRKRKEITDEVKKQADEILQLALTSVQGEKNKITYNKLVNFNKEIACNPRYIRDNGQIFEDFGSRFWSKNDPDGNPNYGKLIIDNLKSHDDVISAGEAFIINNRDIESLVDRYHKSPQELKRRLIILFSKNKNEIASLQKRNNQLTDKLKLKNEAIKQFEEGFATLFWNSTSVTNSLDDVLTLERRDDNQVNDELLNMFGNDKDRISNLLDRQIAKGSIDAPKKLANVKNDEEEDVQSRAAQVDNVSNLLSKLGLKTSEEEGF